MVKKGEMRGQPGKKVGCPDRRWLLEGSSIGLLSLLLLPDTSYPSLQGLLARV